MYGMLYAAQHSTYIEPELYQNCCKNKIITFKIISKLFEKCYMLNTSIKVVCDLKLLKAPEFAILVLMCVWGTFHINNNKKKLCRYCYQGSIQSKLKAVPQSFHKITLD